MAHMINFITTSAPKLDMGFSEEFFKEVLKEYGLLGVIVVGSIAALIYFIKYSTKKLDSDEKKAKNEDRAKVMLEEIRGLMDQMKREIDSGRLKQDEALAAIKKEVDALLTEQARTMQGDDRNAAEIRRELQEIKLQLRDIQRDQIYNARERRD